MYVYMLKTKKHNALVLTIHLLASKNYNEEGGNSQICYNNHFTMDAAPHSKPPPHTLIFPRLCVLQDSCCL